MSQRNRRILLVAGQSDERIKGKTSWELICYAWLARRRSVCQLLMATIDCEDAFNVVECREWHRNHHKDFNYFLDSTGWVTSAVIFREPPIHSFLILCCLQNSQIKFSQKFSFSLLESSRNFFANKENGSWTQNWDQMWQLYLRLSHN